MTSFLVTRIVALMLPLLASQALAQFKVQTIQDFESGTSLGLPEDLIHGHNSTPLTTTIAQFGSAELEGHLMTEPDPTVLGNHVLMFEPNQDEPHLSVVYDRHLNRSKLGKDGVALMELDVYLPPSGVKHHTVNIMASQYEQGSKYGSRGYFFYRLGIRNDVLYFSFTNGKASPDIYQRQAIEDFHLKRPGWHRLQMAFHADGNIHLYIDNNEANFSPIKETTLGMVSPGIMVTQFSDSTGVMLTDNLTMSWSPSSSSPLPVSPWRNEDSEAYVGNIDWDNSGIPWQTVFSDAWHMAQDSNKHMFIYLHDADANANQFCIDLLNTQEAQAFMSFVVPLRLNSATRYGKKIASDIGITSTPAFVVLKPDTSPFSKAEVQVGVSGWTEIQGQLTQPTLVN